MLFEHALLLIGIPLILIILGVAKNYGAMVISGGVTLLVIGVLVLASPVVANYDVNGTSEDSFYWNATCNETTLVLQNDTHFAVTENHTGFILDSGTVSDTYTINQVYYVLYESDQDSTSDWQFNDTHGEPDDLHFTGRLWTANPGEGLDVWVYNFTGSAWQSLVAGSPDIPRSNNDNSYIWPYPLPATDFVNGSDAWVRFVLNNAHTDQDHTFYVDYLTIEEHTEGHIYAEAYIIVDCLKDRVEVNYTYSGEELPANDNFIFGLMLALVGLLCIVAGALGQKE